MKVWLAAALVALLCLQAQASSNQVVFVHGLGIPSIVYEVLFPLHHLFTKAGYDLKIARIPVAGTLDERAGILREEIHRLVPKGQFHLIGHSMGGLDSRLAIHRYGLGDRVVSLTTMATPHRGSPIADWIQARLRSPEMGREGSELFKNVFRFFGGDEKIVADLTQDRMSRVFNSKVLDDPRVKYFSMGFYVPLPVSRHSHIPWLWLTHGLVSQAGQEENDSMVSVESALWGQSLGVYPADHYSETAPIPFTGGVDYLDTFRVIIDNLNRL